MNLTEVTAYMSQPAVSEDGLMTRISEVLKDCERCQNLMIGIYLIEKGQFLYYNQKLEQIIGNNCKKLLEEGWSFWFSLVDAEESVWIQDRITNFFAIPYTQAPLSLLYHITNFKGKRLCMKHDIVLHRMDREVIALNYWTDFTAKERIELHFKAALKTQMTSSNNCLQSITSREREVLRLIADGFSSKEIANKLFISNHTAISHRKNLIEKFQVKNTAHLIKRASLMIPL